MTARYVYRCFDAAGGLLYIGQTKSVTNRMEQHRATSFWAPQVAKVRANVYPDGEIAREVERRAIYSENPRYNIRGSKSGRAAWTQADYDGRIAKLAVRKPGHGQRGQYQRLFAEYRARFGDAHPLEAEVWRRLDEFDAAYAIEDERRRATRAERERDFREREEAETALHMEHCCACQFGIVVDDELVEKYGNEFSAIDADGVPA